MYRQKLSLSHYMHWLLRMALASVFIFHGIDKALNPIEMARAMDMPLILISTLAFTEMIGGMMILLGGLGFSWATRIGGFFLMPPMIGAITLVHWGQWRFAPTATHPLGGMEFQVVLLLLATYFAVSGNGIGSEQDAAVEQSAVKFRTEGVQTSFSTSTD